VCEWNGVRFPIEDVISECPEDEFTLTTVREGAISIDMGLLRIADGWIKWDKHGSTDPQDARGAILASLGPPKEPQLVSQMGVGRPAFIAGSTALDGDHIRLVLTDGTTRRVELAPGPPELGWSFWGAFIQRWEDLAGVELVDHSGEVIDSAGPYGSTGSPFSPGASETAPAPSETPAP
jgi:hypothetical protein